jgi:hypothetical protein
VVCWRTKAEDAAAHVFAKALFASLKLGRSVADSFSDAENAVTLVTRPGKVNGLPSTVPKYELRVPYTASTSSAYKPTPLAAGVPVLLA